MKVDSVTKMPYSGLFELWADNDIFYTDAGAKYVFVGWVMDAKSLRDYARERIDDINKVKFADLSFDPGYKKSYRQRQACDRGV